MLEILYQAEELSEQFMNQLMDSVEKGYILVQEELVTKQSFRNK